MKKSDLKNSMVIECLNGERYLVLNNIFVRFDGYNPFKSYDDNLECTDCLEFNIIKVYNVKGTCTYLGEVFEDYNLKLIWSRENIKEDKKILELTLEDIAKKFNIDVTQLKIKK